MVGCNNFSCSIEWFHSSCVDLSCDHEPDWNVESKRLYQNQKSNLWKVFSSTTCNQAHDQSSNNTTRMKPFNAATEIVTCNHPGLQIPTMTVNRLHISHIVFNYTFLCCGLWCPSLSRCFCSFVCLFICLFFHHRIATVAFSCHQVSQSSCLESLSEWTFIGENKLEGR